MKSKADWSVSLLIEKTDDALIKEGRAKLPSDTGREQHDRFFKTITSSTAIAKWDADDEDGVPFLVWFVGVREMVDDMGFDEKVGMKVIMPRLSKGARDYWRDFEASQLRAGANPYTYSAFETHMLLAYGKADDDEKHFLAFWHISQNGPLQPFLL